MSYLRACDFEEDWLCLSGGDDALMRCNGTYAHVRGYLVPNPLHGALDGACGEHILEISEVLEARLCEASDCAPCSEGFDCHSTCWGEDSCDPGETCTPWGLPQEPYSARRCVPPQGDVILGGSCSVDAEAPWFDDCEPGAICFDGRCRGLCDEDTDYGCAQGHCFWSAAVPVCLPGCNPFGPECARGEACTRLGLAYTCMDREAVSFFDPPDCAGTSCGPLQICVDPDQLSDCTEAACCTDLCDTAVATCGVGLACVDRWDDEEFPELAGMGICQLPA